MKVTVEFIIKSFDIVDSKKWNQKLLKSEYSLAPQTANWQYTLKEIFNSEPCFISVIDSKGELLGQLSG